MMLPTSGNPGLGFGDPARYRIVVQGVLGKDWSERLAGLWITTTSEGEGPRRTILQGPLRDQAELNGVLTTLHALHLSLLSVEKLDDDPSEDGAK